MITLRTPLQIGSQGGFSTTDNVATIIEQRITDLLVTNHGERVMLPNHGADLDAFLFSPVIDELLSTKAQDIRQLLARKVGLGSILSVEVSPVIGESSSVRIAVTYQVEPGTAPRTLFNTVSGLVTEETVFN